MSGSRTPRATNARAATGSTRCARHMNASTALNPAARQSLASAGWIHRAAKSGASSAVNPARTHPVIDAASNPLSPHSSAFVGVRARPQLQGRLGRGRACPDP